MKKCIVIPDSFKGSMSSIEICGIAKEEINKTFPACEVVCLPIADGGEGTAECFLQALNGKKVQTPAHGPYGEPLVTFYTRVGKTAIIEMAKTAGLPLVEENKNPMLTGTYGVGEQIRHSIEHGAEKIVLGLGGSCTNDGGCGCAAAMGVKFYDETGKTFVPVGGTLNKISKIDTADAANLLKGCTITCMCDINNPMYGKNGAAYIFAPQKGADENMVEELDNQLKALDRIIQSELGLCVADIPGAGAAGAMGAGMVAFLGAALESGIEIVLDTVAFSEKLAGADYVITGEGRLDSQSLSNKAVIGVAKRAKKGGVPVIALVGDVGDDAYAAYDMGVNAIFSINRLAIPFSEAKLRSKTDYRNTLRDILKLISAAENNNSAHR